jgi:hypothetical protein
MYPGRNRNLGPSSGAWEKIPARLHVGFHPMDAGCKIGHAYQKAFAVQPFVSSRLIASKWNSPYVDK